MTENIADEIEETVEAAKAPGVFNILNILRERGLPKDTVQVILDDSRAYEAAKLQVRIEELMNSAAENVNEEVKALQEKLEALTEELNGSRYTFYITGISESERDKLVAQAVKKFPLEFEEQKNPFTGETSKKEIDNDEREDLFTSLLWAASIEKIVAPDGSEQVGLAKDDVREMRGMLSLPANAAVTQAIEKLRIATAVFVMKADEDFLAKS